MEEVNEKSLANRIEDVAKCVLNGHIKHKRIVGLQNGTICFYSGESICTKESPFMQFSIIKISRDNGISGVKAYRVDKKGIIDFRQYADRVFKKAETHEKQGEKERDIVKFTDFSEMQRYGVLGQKINSLFENKGLFTPEDLMEIYTDKTRFSETLKKGGVPIYYDKEYNRTFVDHTDKHTLIIGSTASKKVGYWQYRRFLFWEKL